MKVSAVFNEQGLSLQLYAETDQEKKMVGAVINQPFHDPNYGRCEVDSCLLGAIVSYDGHYSNKSVSILTLRLHRQENAGTPTGDKDLPHGR